MPSNQLLGRIEMNEEPAILRFTRRTLQDNVYAELRASLMSGRLPPGHRLTVRGVAEIMGTSVMPVREAFRRLTTEGALEPLATGATRVPILDVGAINDLVEIRLEIEGLATRRAALRITDAELDSLNAANEEMKAGIRKHDAYKESVGNQKFHFGIYRAAGSPELLRIVEQLWLKMGPCLVTLLAAHNQSNPAAAQRGVQHHGSLIDALRRHNPEEAEAALRADLRDAAVFFTAVERRNRKIAGRAK